MSERHYLGHTLGGEVLNRGFVFDANVWIFLQGPLQDHESWQSKAYSAFYSDVIKAGSEVYLPLVVATEFANRCLTLLAQASGWNRQAGKIHAEKDYLVWSKDACDSLNAIVGDSTRIDDDFSSVKLEPLYDEIERGRLDFNDHLIIDLCRRHGLTLVTHDADYADIDLPIVTANKRLS